MHFSVCSINLTNGSHFELQEVEYDGMEWNGMEWKGMEFVRPRWYLYLNIYKILHCEILFIFSPLFFSYMYTIIPCPRNGLQNKPKRTERTRYPGTPSATDWNPTKNKRFIEETQRNFTTNSSEVWLPTEVRGRNWSRTKCAGAPCTYLPTADLCQPTTNQPGVHVYVYAFRYIIVIKLITLNQLLWLSASHSVYIVYGGAKLSWVELNWVE